MIFPKIDSCYGWTEANIKIGEKMVSHVAHYMNNPLAMIVPRVKKLMRLGQEIQVDTKALEVCLQKNDILGAIVIANRMTETGTNIETVGQKVDGLLERIIGYVQWLIKLGCEPSCDNKVCLKKVV